MSAASLFVTPYKGLMPYEEKEADAQFFFGRESEREIIIANLMASRLTLLYGASGVGKSSVLRAGVAFRLRQLARQNIAELGSPEFAVVVFRDWRDDPIVGLTSKIHKSVGQLLNGRGVDPGTSGSLAQTLQAWTERIDGDLLIILDQFEDYFLYHEHEDGEGTFAFEFPRAVNDPALRVSFLISIREESLAKLDRFAEDIPQLFDNRLPIEHLDHEAARDAIEKPKNEYNRVHAGAEPVVIEEKLIEEVLKQVETGQVFIGEGGRGVVKTDAAEPRIETPYLQLVMKRLWEEEMRLRSRVLRLETLTGLGDKERSGAQNIVRAHLDEVMDALSDEDKDVAANVFHYLVTPDVNKIALTATALASYGQEPLIQVTPLLDSLCTSEIRILHTIDGPVNQPDNRRYEIFHDVLAPAILDWRRRHVQQQEDARKAEALTAAELRAEEQRKRAEEKAKLARRLKRLSIALIVTVVLLVAATVGMLCLANKEQHSRRAAEENLAIAEKSKLEEEQAKRSAVEGDRFNRDTLSLMYQAMYESGKLQEILGRLKENLPRYQKGEAEKKALSLNNIGGIYRALAEIATSQGSHQQAQKYYEQAEEAYRQAKTLLEEKLSNSYYLGNVLNDLAVVYLKQRKYAEAEQYFNKALELLSQYWGPDDMDLADSLSNLATLYRAQHKYDAAEQRFVRALAIREKVSPTSLYTALSLNDLAVVYREQGRYAEAEQRFKQALEIREKKLESENRDTATFLLVATSLNGLARLYYKMGEYTKAELAFKRALEIRETHSPGSRDMAESLNGLAVLYRDQGRYAEAEQLFKRALAIREKIIPDHPDLADTLKSYADLLRKIHREDKAARMEARATAILAKQPGENTPK